MENSTEKNVTISLNIPQVRDSNESPRVVSNAKPFGEEEKHKEIPENNGHMMSLPINSTGETQANLAQVIAHYVGTLNKKQLRFLGKHLIL